MPHNPHSPTLIAMSSQNYFWHLLTSAGIITIWTFYMHAVTFYPENMHCNFHLSNVKQLTFSNNLQSLI